MGASRRPQCCLLKTFSIKNLDNAFQRLGEDNWFLPQPPASRGLQGCSYPPYAGLLPTDSSKAASVPITRLHFTPFSSV